MAQIIKLSKFLIQVDGANIVFLDSMGNPLGLPQDLLRTVAVDFPDGTKMPIEQLTELLSGGLDRLGEFETAAGKASSTDEPIEANSGGGRFAVFKESQSIGGLKSIGGLQETELSETLVLTKNQTRSDPNTFQAPSTFAAKLNTLPTAEGKALTLAEDSVVRSSVRGLDIDGDNLSYTLVTGPQHGIVAFNADGTFTYTPVGNYNGADSFTFKANDGSGDSNVSTVSLTISPVNDLPVSEGNSLTLAEDSVVRSSVRGSDIDGDSLSYTLVDAPQHGTVAFNADGTFVYTPVGNYNGADSFTFKANDGTGDSNVSTVRLTISPINDLPVSEGNTLTLAEDSVVRSSVRGSDIDGDNLSYTLVDAPQHGTVAFNADGTFTYTPVGNYNGADSFTFKANDGSGDSNVSTVSLTISPVNDLPVSEGNSLTLAEDSVVRSSVRGSDIDGDNLSYTLVDAPQHGTVAFNADGTFTYTPVGNYNGADSFTFKANDGSGDSNVSTVSLTISPVNDLPVSEGNSLTLAEDSVVRSSVRGSDIDGDNLSYTLVDAPQHGTVAFNADGTFVYTPVGNYNGADSFTFKANDGTGDSNVSTVSLTISPVNDLPVSEGNTLTLAEDSVVRSSVRGSDIDGDNLSYTLVDAPQHGTVTFNADGTFVYTPVGNYNGTDSFTFKANDGTGDSNVSTVSLTISPVNDLPVAEGNTLTLAEDSVVRSSVRGSDIDGDNLSYTLVDAPQHGTVTFNADGTFVYTPVGNYNGADSFTFKANDGTGDSNVSTVSLTISPVNDLPVSDDGSVTLKEDSVVRSAVRATDVDGDVVTYTLVNAPQHGTIQFNPNGTYTYTPVGNYSGADSFTFKANDGRGDSNIGKISLNVTPVNDAPVTTGHQSASVETHITRVSVEQNPFGDSKVGDYLASGGTDSKAVNPSMINGVNPSNLTLAQSADVKVSFVSEGAGYRSMVGTYTYDAKGNIDPASVKLLWLDATQNTQNVAGGALVKDFLGNNQAQDISLGNLAADTKMGFFIIADGASQPSNTKALAEIGGVDSRSDNQANDLAAINKHLSFTKDANGNGQILLDGRALSGNVYFTHDKTLNTDANSKDIEHTLSGVTTKADGNLYIGFEDLAGGGDSDYDDVIIKIDIGSYNTNKLSQLSTQPIIYLSDIDSSHLSSAVISTRGFNAGDALNLPSNSSFTVASVAHGNDVTYTITPKAGFESVAVFEDFLNHAFFSTTSTNDGHRTISYQVTDADGLSSNVSNIDVNVSSSYEISVSELNSLNHLGSGDDILHFNATLGKALDLGTGHDIVHLVSNNMSFSSAEARKLDNVEVIDARDAGNNRISLSANDVLDMTDGDHHLTILGQKGDTLTLTGDGTHHWTATDRGADFITYTYNDGTHQAIVDVSNQMAMATA